MGNSASICSTLLSNPGLKENPPCRSKNLDPLLEYTVKTDTMQLWRADISHSTAWSGLPVWARFTEDVGFSQGWGITLTQLDEFTSKLYA